MSGGKLAEAGSSKATGMAHSVTLTDLKPETAYAYLTTASADGYPDTATLDYEFITLGENGIPNAGFEEGFVVEIAKQWRCLGDNLCWDSARLPAEFRLAHSAKHAQCIVANGGWGDGLDDTVAGQAFTKAGKTVAFTAWTCAVNEGKDGAIARKIGIDPLGGMDPNSPNLEKGRRGGPLLRRRHKPGLKPAPAQEYSSPVDEWSCPTPRRWPRAALHPAGTGRITRYRFRLTGHTSSSFQRRQRLAAG